MRPFHNAVRLGRGQFFPPKPALSQHADASPEKRYSPKRSGQKKFNPDKTRKGSVPLSATDISEINKQFLERTSGLEPEFEIKQLEEIREEYNERYSQRYLKPSRKWYLYDWENPSKSPVFQAGYINGQFPVSMDTQPSQCYNFAPSHLNENTLTVGDLVLLQSDPTQLVMCVCLPDSRADPRYTFVSRNGELIFHMKHQVKLRIPYDLPDNVVQLIEREALHGYTPIGKVKNNREETYIIPLLAKQLFSNSLLAKINNNAWEQIPLVVKKLKVIHRVISNPSGPIQFSYVQLCQIVEHLDLSRVMKLKATQETNLPSTSVVEYINTLVESIGQQNTDRVESATYVATYFALQEQQEYSLWGKIHSNAALLSPISVTVLPLKSQHYYYSQILSQMRRKDHKEVDAFVRLFNESNFDSIKKEYGHYLNLLTDYAAGNFHNNPQVVALVSHIFRKIGKYKDSDITKDICFELIKTVNADLGSANVLHYNKDLNLPIASDLAKDRKRLYDIVEPSDQISEGIVHHDALRREFLDHTVYCIDSADAHEIDDGISIKKTGNGKYTIFVHIADPASMFEESHDQNIENEFQNEVLQAALEKSFTSYLPDNVDPMLPKAFSKAADLGLDGEKRRTITFSVDVLLNSDHTQFRILPDTFDVCLSYTKNFPSVTYDDVDQILSKKVKADKKMTDDLQSLFNIAVKLRQDRVTYENAIVFGEGFNDGLPQLTPNPKGKEEYDISFKDNTETSSTILVSEMMILANTLCGLFFTEKGIPGVFRCYSHLTMSKYSGREFKSLQDKVKKGSYPSPKDISQFSSFLNSSFYSSTPSRHAMVGAPEYLTVTSPLRRFPDLVNHLQLHRYLAKKKLLFSQSKVTSMIWRFQSRADIIKSTSRLVNKYWTLNYLIKNLKNNPDQRFDVVVNSVPVNGTVRCTINGYSFSTGTLKFKKGEAPPGIGDIVHNCKITNILPIEGVLDLENDL